MKEVKISLKSFVMTLDVLENILSDGYFIEIDGVFIREILDEFRHKRDKLVLEEKYKNLMQAHKNGDLDKIEVARIEYLKEKNKNKSSKDCG